MEHCKLILQPPRQMQTPAHAMSARPTQPPSFMPFTRLPAELQCKIIGIAWRDCFARRGNVISIAFAARLSSLRVTHSWHLVNVNTLFRQEVIRLSKGKSASAFQATLPREVIRIDPETTTLELDFSHAFEVPPKTHLRQPSNEVCARTKRLRLRFAYSTYDRYMAQLHIGGTREADLLDFLSKVSAP
jgi:hypothetical protein